MKNLHTYIHIWNL